MRDVFKFLKINKSYNDRKEEIKSYMQKAKQHKTLCLNVLSNNLKNSKEIFSINPYGMINGANRIGKDGIVLFGYEVFNDLKGNLEEEDNNKQNMSVYDFVFPIEDEDSFYMNNLPSFSIYFNTKDENYYIKDFNIGIGALMKIKKYKIENNTLINIGANYLVICIKEENLVIKIFNNCILKNKAEDKKYETKNFKINKNIDASIIIGRSKKCDLSIEDMMMSKIQSCIKYFSKENAFYLYDGNSEKESMNGTWVYILNPVLIKDNFIFKAEHTLFVVNIVNIK